MEIEEYPVFKEVKKIIDSGPKPISFSYKARIRVRQDEFEVIKVIDIDNRKDYANNFADEILLKALVPLGLWAKVVFPYRDELDILVIKKPLKENNDEEDKKEEIVVATYTAIPIIDKDTPIIQGKDLDRATMMDLDKIDMFPLTFQLYDKGIEKLRGITVGGIFRRCKNYVALKVMLMNESKKIKVDNKSAIAGVDVIDGDNKDEREHYVIPQGIKLIDLAQYMQRRLGGIYNCDINQYYHDKFWFVYPLFNTTRYPKAEKKAIIFKVPSTRYQGIERTYRTEGNITYILATSDSDFSDERKSKFLNSGSGVRFTDARRHMRDIVEKKDNKAIIKREKVNHEYLFDKKDSKDKNTDRQDPDMVFLSEQKIHSNPYAESSVLASKWGSTYQFKWENSDDSMLFPGMMIKIHYQDKDQLKELNGVLLFVHTSIQMKGSGIISHRFQSTTDLIVFANRPDGEKKTELNKLEIGQKDQWSKYESI